MPYGIAALTTSLKWNGYKVAELTNITGPNISLDTIDVSSHDSPGYKEFVTGLADGGDISIEGRFYPGDTNGQVALIADALSKQMREAVVTFPDGSTWTANALVTAFSSKAPSSGSLDFSATLKVSAQPVFGVNLAVDLTGLTMTDATFNPTFATDIYEYVVEAVAADPTITPVCATADKITVNGDTVASGSPYTLDAGEIGDINDVTVTTFKAGYTPNTYRIKMYRST